MGDYTPREERLFEWIHCPTCGASDPSLFEFDKWASGEFSIDCLECGDSLRWDA